MNLYTENRKLPNHFPTSNQSSSGADFTAGSTKNQSSKLSTGQQISAFPSSPVPTVPDKSLYDRCIIYAQGIICSLINWEKSEFLYTEEFIDRLLNKKDFDPNTLYIVRANLAEELVFSPSGLYDSFIDPVYPGTVDLSNMKITQWPDKLRINGSLNLSGARIDKLPKTLIVNHDLNISDCSSLTSLSENKTVVGRELIAHNSGLTGINSDLEAGSLDLSGSVNLEKFSDEHTIEIRGDIILDDCPKIYGNIPDWLLTGMGPIRYGVPRHISLLKTGIQLDNFNESIRHTTAWRPALRAGQPSSELKLGPCNGRTYTHML